MHAPHNKDCCPLFGQVEAVQHKTPSSAFHGPLLNITGHQLNTHQPC